MDNKKVVVALGRNAFGETFAAQKENVKKAARAVADLVGSRYQVVVTHSNGPQVGMIRSAMSEYAKLDKKSGRTEAPMSVCGAMSEGYIGYDLQNAIREELLDRGIYKTVATIITQVRVDPFDRAFSEPTKVIGLPLTKEEADAEEEKGNYVTEVEPGVYKRIIASPMPIDIYEIDAIRTLSDAGQVIEKDYTAMELASQLGASTLLFLTGYEKLTIGKGTPQEKSFDSVTAKELQALMKEGVFPAITTFPKVDASIRFVNDDPNRQAIITSLEKVKEALAGTTGTRITK